jgi:hypothetical protein
MIFLKEHLTGKYLWHNEEDKSSFTGEASRRLFDRFNGDQVLFMINLFGSLQKTFTIEDGQKIEAYINNRLPLENQSELSVLDYLRKLSRAESINDTVPQDEFMHHSDSNGQNPT